MTEGQLEKVGAQPAERPGPKARASRARSAGKNIPDGAKKPADHQPAKNDVVEPKVKTITWKTKPGEVNEDGTPGDRVPAEYTIDPLVFDDIDFVEQMIAMDDAKNNEARTVYAFKALRLLLGAKQFEQYKENARDPETGRSSFSETIPFFNFIYEELKQGNS